LSLWSTQLEGGQGDDGSRLHALSKCDGRV
jgi:hypothetical protein